MARSDATDFVIEVLEGPAADATIVLSGRSLPFRSAAGGAISFGSTQRSQLVWYPGNPRATQHVFGRTLQPTTVNGLWQDRYLGTDVAIDLVEQVQELLDTGVQLRVSWSTIERIGIIKQFVWRPGEPTGGLGDVAWEVTFEWSREGAQAFGQAVQQSLSSRTPRDGAVLAGGLLADIEALADDLIAVKETFVGARAALMAGARATVDALQEESAAAIRSVETAAIRLGANDSDTTGAIAGELTAAYDRGMDSAALYLETINALHPGRLTPLDDPAALLLQTIGQVDLYFAALEALEVMFEEQLRLEAEHRPDAFVTIRPVKRSDLRDVALRFYGNADLWRFIAKANGLLEGSTIPETVDEIVVPLVLDSSLDPLSVGC